MRRPLSRLIAALAVAAFNALVALPLPAASQTCTAYDTWVQIELIATSWPEALRTAVLKRTTSILNAEEIGVCRSTSERADAPVGTVILRVESTKSVTLNIDVQDHLTVKRVMRKLQVNPKQETATAMLIAISVDELLRASWAELAYKDHPRTPRPVPPPVEAKVSRNLRPDIAPRRARSFALGASLRAQLFGDGLFSLGPGLSASAKLTARWSIDARAALLWFERVRVPEGELSVQSFTAALGLNRVLLEWPSGFRVGASSHLELGSIFLFPEATAGRTATGGTLTTLSLLTELLVALRWEHTDVLLSAGPNWSLRGGRATANGRDIANLSGPSATAALAARYRF